MLVGLMGPMGQGKTLMMSILMLYMQHAFGARLSANYDLKGASLVRKTSELWALEGGIFGYDELWLDLDARESKKNVFLTRLINQSRKKKLAIFYTTQHIRQVDVRVRNATDILIVCKKTSEGHWFQIIDWQYRELRRKYFISFKEAAQFYNVYDTYQVLQPIVDDGVAGLSEVQGPQEPGRNAKLAPVRGQ